MSSGDNCHKAGRLLTELGFIVLIYTEWKYMPRVKVFAIRCPQSERRHLIAKEPPALGLIRILTPSQLDAMQIDHMVLEVRNRQQGQKRDVSST